MNYNKLLAKILFCYIFINVALAADLELEVVGHVNKNNIYAKADVISARINYLRKYFEKEQYNYAYKIAKSMESEYSGILEFDYLFGLLAVSVSKPAEAIFPLERVITKFPDNYRARLELGLAFYLVGDFVTAKSHFEEVKKNNPPENVLNRITVILNKIDTQQGSKEFTLTKNVGLGLGYDSNINNISKIETVDIPTATLILSEEDQKKDDYYSDISLNVKGNHPLDKNNKITSNLYLNNRYHVNHRKYDQATASLQISPEMSFKYGKLNIPVSASYVYVDRDAFLRNLSIGSSWSYQLTEKTDNTLIANVYKNDYKTQPSQDVRGLHLASNFTHSLKPIPLMLISNFSYRKHYPRHEEGKHNGKNSLSAGVNGIYIVDDKNLATTGIEYSRDHYDTLHPVFANLRKDHYLKISLGWRMQVNENLAISPYALYLKSNSNIQLYDYTKSQVGVNANYQF